MMVVPSWTSERLVYRITSRADVENVVAALSDLKTSESIYWVPKPYTMADAEDWIARAERGWLSGEEFLFSAFVKNAGDYTGSINLHKTGDGEAEIGYWVASAFQGQGFATEMVAFIIGFCASSMRTSLLDLQVTIS
jgi:[ribosomal protein S5]-alanine N-acetyltransferase